MHKDLGTAASGSSDLTTKAYTDYKDTAVPSYAPTTLLNRYDNNRGIYNFKASNTRRLDQGMSIAKAGGHTHHMIIGDSVSAGATSGIGVTTYDRLRAWSLCMRDSLAAAGVPANGTGFVRMVDNGQFDSRWTQIAGTGTFAQQTSWMFWSTVGTATFVPDRSGTVFELGYLDSGTATMTVSIDGASSGSNFGTFTTAASGGTWKKFRMTGCAVRVNSIIKITITVIGTGVGISGASVWTPNAGLIIDNEAQSGSTAYGTGASAWNDFSAGPYFVFKDVSQKGRTITDAVTTAGSNVLTSATAAFTTNDQGESIDQFPDTTGALFPPNTYMVTRTSATTMVMSQNALVSATAKTLRLSRDPSCVHIALGGNDMMQFVGTVGLSTAISNMTTAITNLRNAYPNSDCILHLENEPSTTLATAPTEAAFQAAMYSLADTLDVPLYDWRDRAGNYATAFANGVMQDYQAHMVPGMYADLGSSLAMAIGGGSATPQGWSAPVYDGDLTNKRYVDNLRIRKNATPGTTATTTTEGVVMSLFVPANTFKVGSTIEYNMTIRPSTTTILTNRIRIGSTGTTSDAAVVLASATATTSVAPRQCIGVFAIQAIGASATFLGTGSESYNAIITTGNQGAVSGSFDSTKDNWITVTTQATTSATTTINSGFIEIVP